MRSCPGVVTRFTYIQLDSGDKEACIRCQCSMQLQDPPLVKPHLRDQQLYR